MLAENFLLLFRLFGFNCEACAQDCDSCNHEYCNNVSPTSAQMAIDLFLAA